MSARGASLQERVYGGAPGTARIMIHKSGQGSMVAEFSGEPVCKKNMAVCKLASGRTRHAGKGLCRREARVCRNECMAGPPGTGEDHNPQVRSGVDGGRVCRRSQFAKKTWRFANSPVAARGVLVRGYVGARREFAGSGVWRGLRGQQGSRVARANGVTAPASLRLRTHAPPLATPSRNAFLHGRRDASWPHDTDRGM